MFRCLFGCVHTVVYCKLFLVRQTELSKAGTFRLSLNSFALNLKCSGFHLVHMVPYLTPLKHQNTYPRDGETESKEGRWEGDREREREE